MVGVHDAREVPITLQDVLDTVDESFVAFDRDFRYLYLNRVAHAVLRNATHRADDLTGQILWEAFPALHASPLGAKYREAMAASAPTTFEELSPISGRWFVFRAYPNARGMSLFVRDVTEQKEAAHALREGKERLAALVDHALDGILLTSPAGTVLSANPAACAMLGRTEADICATGRGIVDAQDPHLATLSERRTRTGSAAGELRLIRGDGTTFPAHLTSAIFKDAHGELRTSMTIRDLSEQKRLEQAQTELLASLRESEELFRLTFERAPIGMALISLEGRFLRVNRRLGEIIGYAPDELHNAHFMRFTHPEDRRAHVELLDQLLRPNGTRCELTQRYLHKDGRTVDALLHVAVVRDETGEARMFVAQIQDLTEKHELQSQLVLADRLASVGTLAGGVAHEINNPLCYVVYNLELVQNELADPQRMLDPDRARAVRDALQDAVLGADRVRRIVRELKTFSRPETEQAHSVDVDNAIDVAVRMVNTEIRHRASLVMEMRTTPKVMVDEARLTQVVINLLVNAAHAIPEGKAAQNEIRIKTYTDAKGLATIEISDTGGGIAAEVLPRIFDPFFTTKPVGVGTGLGLSVSHTIIKAMGGAIEVESELGKGSLFRVTLPPQSQSRPRPSAPTRSRMESIRPLRGRVLLIDDDELVAKSLQRVLSREHAVTVSFAGREALDRIVGGERFDIILCDLLMPNVTGMDVFRSLTEHVPQQAARMVFMSGGAFTPCARAFLDQVTNLKLDKPVESHVLRSVVQDMLLTP